MPVGESVVVHGFVDDDLDSRVRPEFYAHRIVRADGTVLELHPPQAEESSAEAPPSVAGSSPPSSPGPAAAVITPIDALARGITATIEGRVTRILDEDEFRIEDATGSIRVYIGWKNRVTLPVGETVVVTGFVDNDLVAFFRPEFYATEITRADGLVISLH